MQIARFDRLSNPISWQFIIIIVLLQMIKILDGDYCVFVGEFHYTKDTFF